MTDVKVYGDKHITYWWVSDGGFVNAKAPTPAEINAGANLSAAIAWDGTEINPEDSSDIDDAAITDSATAVEPGFDQFGGTLNLFYPKDMTDLTDPYVIAYNIFAPGRIKGYLVRRFTPADVNTDTSSPAAAAGQWVEIFYVQADFTAHDTEGEDSTKASITFLPQGFMSGIVMVKSSDPVVVTPASKAMSVNDVEAATAAVDGVPVTMDVSWSSDDTSIASVSAQGVVTAHAQGSATITAAYASAGASGTLAVTVS